MKTFTATQLNKSPQEVFAAAKEDGGAAIDHSRFNGGKFVITWEKEHEGCKHFCDEKTMICNKCGEQCIRIGTPSPMSLLEYNGGFKRPEPYREP